MTDTKISAYLVTLNEAATIAEAIKSVSEFDEVIVVDSGSTDGTVENAEALGAKVIHQRWLGFAQQKAFALSQCRHEWCINLDGDEVLPPQACDELKKIVNSGGYDLVRFPIEDTFIGAPMHPLSRKRTIVRAFKKSKVRYPLDRLVHENIIGEGREIRAKNAIVHYGYDRIETFMEKQIKYAQLAAETKFRRGKKASSLKLVFIFMFTFTKVYFFRRLFLSGRRGIIQAHIEAMYAFLKESSLYEKSQREQSRDGVRSTESS